MGYSKLTYEGYVARPGVWDFDPPLHAAELSNRGYPGVSAVDFYDDIFGDDLEEERMPEDYRTGEYGGIAIERIPQVDESGAVLLNSHGHAKYVGRRYTITKENMELYELIDRSENFCMVAPISYAGRTRKNENARYMYALCIEVDYIEPKNGLAELIYSWHRTASPMPCPTYIVCSGNGLHLYYVFERPIPLWRNIFEQLTEVKKYFTPWFWNKYVTTAHKAIQYESINQPFRCVGSRTKGNSYAMAFRTGDKVTIEYMNQFLPEDKRLDCVYKSNCTLEQAKELYPEWYQRRIVQGQARGHFNRHQPIYYNWIKKILAGAVVGTRYNCLENLCSLAVQCCIAPDQVEKDCRMIAEHFESLTETEDNHFTEYDILCALKTYHTAGEQAYYRRIEYITKKTGITLIENKRNGRKQKEHLRADYWRNDKGRPAANVCRQNREIALQYMREKGEILGRPKGSSKEKIMVAEWRAAHPDGRKCDCIRDTGLNKKTVYRWWEEKP